MNGLCEKTLICNPVNKARSVALTDEGARRAKALFFELFAYA